MTATKPSSLGGIEFDAIVSRTETMDADVPSYATESGFAVSDNICNKALSLGVEAVISNSPVTWASEHTPSSSRVETLCDELHKLWKARKVLTFTAGSDVYENMCIESLKLPRKVETGSSIHIEFSLKQVTITETETTSIDIKYARGGKSSQNTGAGQSKSSSAASKSSGDDNSSGTRSSVLCSAAKAVGLFK